MRLSAVRLAGFKSFVDPTTLALTSNLTAVVGPNGCGKSNVIDAVRWVTGESSARALRGEAAEDVIFNGSRARRPVGAAAVELKFDNSQGKLGGRYAAFAEISIRRELARDGASRYLINGARARRRDVIDLLLGTGLGGRSNYAVIEQGAVNRLIEARPEELRQILEEAAGISTYKQRRRETENRMRHTRENLERVDDLIGEVGQRLEVLKCQAAAAEKYKRLKVDERRLKRELLALRWVAQNTEVEAANAHLYQREGALAQAVSAQQAAQAKRDAAQQAQQAALQHVQACQGEFYDAQAQAQRIAQALAHARELDELRERERAELTAQIERLAERATADGDADEKAAAEQAQARMARAHAQARLDEAGAALARAHQAADAAEAAWDALNSGQDNPVGQLAAQRQRADYAEQRLVELKKRREARAGERADLADTADTDLEAVERDINQRSARIAADDAAAREAGDEEQARQRAVAAAERDSNACRREFGENQAALAAEKKLQQSVLREDDTAIAQWLERAAGAGALAIARRVTVRRGWQSAAEAALGPWLRGFIVASLPAVDDDLLGHPLCLIEDDQAAARPPAQPAPAGLPCLADGIQAPAAVKAAAARVFVVEDIASALALRDRLGCGQRLVTLNGCCVGRHSLFTPAGEAAEKGVLEREQRIAALSAAVARGERDYAERVQTLESQREKQRAARERQRQLERDAAQARRALEGQRADLEGQRVRAAQNRRRAAELDRDLAELAEQVDSANAESAGAARCIDDLAQAAERFSAERRAAQAEVAKARAARDAARTDCDNAQAALREIDAKLDRLASRREAIAARLTDTGDARAEAAARLAALDADGQRSAAGDVDEAAHERAREAQTGAERALRAARTALESAEKTVAAAGQGLLRAEQALDAARQALQADKICAETASARASAVSEQIVELGEDPAVLVQRLPENADSEQTHAAIDTVERKIARLGAINLAAIQEYDGEAEREAYLQSQHADLTAALATLESAIAKIDGQTRARFKTTYEQVSQRLSKLFGELFGGGEASLELTEHDWLTTGVKVMARPPGKRNASIQMLSGGEKALTAIALLFALFELNPAPFCMLDEIDAPLDDANVARFCALVRRISARVQFIVITHNKLTMELAEQLHGVTMAQAGVSRLVSVDIDSALAMAG